MNGKELEKERKSIRKDEREKLNKREKKEKKKQASLGGKEALEKKGKSAC